MQLRLLIVQFQRDLQGAQFLRVQAQLGALLAVAVEHQHLLVQRLLPLRAAQLRVELRRRRCGHQCAGRSGRLRWAGGGQGDGVVERRWLLRIARRQRLCGACTFAVGRLRERRLALSPSVADVFAPVSDGAGMPMNARRFYHRPPRCSAGHCRAAAQSLRQRYPPAASVGLRPVAPGRRSRPAAWRTAPAALRHPALWRRRSAAAPVCRRRRALRPRRPQLKARRLRRSGPAAGRRARRRWSAVD